MERLSWDLCNRFSSWLLPSYLFICLFVSFFHDYKRCSLVYIIFACLASGYFSKGQIPEPKVCLFFKVCEASSRFPLHFVINADHLLQVACPFFFYESMVQVRSHVFFCQCVYLWLIFKSSLYVDDGNPLAVLSVEHTGPPLCSGWHLGAVLLLKRVRWKGSP